MLRSPRLEAAMKARSWFCSCDRIVCGLALVIAVVENRVAEQARALKYLL